MSDFGTSLTLLFLLRASLSRGDELNQEAASQSSSSRLLMSVFWTVPGGIFESFAPVSGRALGSVFDKQGCRPAPRSI